MVTIPEGPFWAIILTVCGALISLGAVVVRNTQALNGKRDKVDCLEAHANLRVEIMAMSKDIEALARQAGIEPTPSPARNGGGRSHLHASPPGPTSPE